MPKSEGRRCSWPPGCCGLPGPVGDQEAIPNRKCQCPSNIQKTYSSLSLLPARLSRGKDFGLARGSRTEGKRGAAPGSQSGARLAEFFLRTWHLCVGCIGLRFLSRKRVFLKEICFGISSAFSYFSLAFIVFSPIFEK